MKALIAIAGLAFLAGCVSPADLENNEPSIAASTPKSPKAYALCVFPKWQAARADSSMAETEQGYRLWVASNSMTDELLDIKAKPDGSSVVLKQRMPWSPGVGRGDIEKAVRTCL